jgi:transcriptional regulator with XRE-family HTH domain
MPPRLDPSALNRAFGRAVRQRREELELSQEDLCFRSDLDRTYISGIERGVRNPTIKTICRIAAALGVAPSRLIGAAERAVDAPTRGPRR